MTENQFDEFFRDKLQQHASQVPDDMWQRITEKKDKDRKIFFIPRWYYLTALLLLLAISGTVYFIHTQTINNGNKNSALDNNNKNSINADTASVSAQDNSSAITKRDIAGNVSGISATTEKNKNKFKIEVSTTQRNKYKLKNNASTFGQQDQQTFEKNIVTNNDKKNATNVEENEKKIKSADSVIINQQQNNLTTKQNSLLVTDSLNNEAEKGAADSLPEPKNHLSLEAYISPDIPFGKISSSNTTYEDERNAASKMKLSYTIGARLSGPLGKHYLWKIGFQYSQINEKYQSLDSTATYGSIIHNHFKSLDIPLLLGYKTGGNSFNFSVSTGILLNVTSKYSGKILDAFSSNINISNAYKSNTGISLYLGSSVSTALNNKIELFAEPYFKYRLNNIAQTQQPFSQKIHTLGLSLGVRCKLFKKQTDN